MKDKIVPEILRNGHPRDLSKTAGFKEPPQLNTVASRHFRIIRADGTVEEHEGNPSIEKLHGLLDAHGLDSVNLRNGCMMMLDDLGHPLDKPTNHKATALYHAVCIPGTTHEIKGDVAIVLDSDFA